MFFIGETFNQFVLGHFLPAFRGTFGFCADGRLFSLSRISFFVPGFGLPIIVSPLSMHCLPIVYCRLLRYRSADERVSFSFYAILFLQV
jgi:hypothetical protein